MCGTIDLTVHAEEMRNDSMLAAVRPRGGHLGL